MQMNRMVWGRGVRANKFTRVEERLRRAYAGRGISAVASELWLMEPGVI